MEIIDVQSFMRYYSKIKARTVKLFDYIPADQIEWSYQDNKFTIGDIIRHLANIERYMYAENVQFKESKYNGCGIEFAEGHKNVIEYYKDMHQESAKIFLDIPQQDLMKKCMTPAGIEISIWKWLRAMVEHEVHHRGQLYMYLAILGVQTPPIFGLTSEEVVDKSI
ncbi:DinB family protein [Aquimarina algicola]|uniref:DinB family protein n=1 Tax=Aquimarina algicola TaxID=2589995 RepID=A0A504JJ58_9FLAO|nr:DinB family protein [Aquimarina algicola]TPN86789.1 DinB family protein [Aquimarina algicola]